MEILSTAWRTDLALVAASGSRIEDRGGYLVVRTPASPRSWWENFVLLRRVPMRRDVGNWRRVFAEELAGAAHCAFGVDDPDATAEDLRPFAEAGFDVEVSSVLTATAVRPPIRPATDVTIRPLDGDADWARRAQMSARMLGGDHARPYGDYVGARVEAERWLAESGLGSWFGAFERDRMVAGLGIFAAGDGLARFQSVETDPSYRRRGLATTLVHAASRHALDDLGAQTLAIVSDAGGLLRRVYESVGFAVTEHQAQAWLPS